MIGNAKMYIKLTLYENITPNVCRYLFLPLTGGSSGSATIIQLASHFNESCRFGRLDIVHVHKVLHKFAVLDPTVWKVWKKFIYFLK